MASVALSVAHPRFIGPINGQALRQERAPSPCRSRSFNELDVSLDARSGTYWCYMRPTERPSFTPALLAELADMQRALRLLISAGETAVRYYVLGSRLPGLFSLGGDLTVLARKIRQRDRQGLVRYSRACIDVLYNNHVSFNLPVVTIALVQGDALGGGFEAALSCDVIIAEKGTRFGLPEVLFNLFPGMGAYSFLARRIGAARAEKLILSGRIHTAEELFEMDIVQVLAEPGAGALAARDYIARNGRRHNAQSAVFRTGRRVSPVTYEELREVTDIWIDAALRLKDGDLRKMERLTAAQNRRVSAPALALAG